MIIQIICHIASCLTLSTSLPFFLFFVCFSVSVSKSPFLEAFVLAQSVLKRVFLRSCVENLKCRVATQIDNQV